MVKQKYNRIVDHNYANKEIILRQCRIFCARALWISKVCKEDLNELQSIRSMLHPFIDQILNKLNLNLNSKNTFIPISTTTTTTTTTTTNTNNDDSNTDFISNNNNMLTLHDSTPVNNHILQEGTVNLLKVENKILNLYKINSNTSKSSPNLECSSKATMDERRRRILLKCVDNAYSWVKTSQFLNRSNVNCKDRYRNIINMLNKANLIADCESAFLNRKKENNENVALMNESYDFNYLKDRSDSLSKDSENRYHKNNLQFKKNVSSVYKEFNLSKENTLTNFSSNSNSKSSIKQITTRKNWSFSETKKLVQLQKEGFNWTQISLQLYPRSNSNCSDRWKTLFKKYQSVNNIYCRFINET